MYYFNLVKYDIFLFLLYCNNKRYEIYIYYIRRIYCIVGKFLKILKVNKFYL